jgi:hypothetical protein
MYADDGLIMSEEKIDYASVINNPRLGMLVNESKSGMVKEDGKRLKELKFLGMVYNPREDTLRSDTRNGKSLKLGED